MKRRCIIFSNCVGSELQRLFNLIPSFANFFETQFVRNYAVKQGYSAEDQSVFKNCDLLLFQIRHWEDVPEFFDWLPPNCMKVSFPAVTFHPFWPLQCKDKRNLPEPEAGCHNGRYPFGDSLALSLLRKGLSPDEAFKTYLETDLFSVVGMNRLEEIALTKMRELDKKVDLPMTSFIEQNAIERRLFRNVMYPTAEMQLYLGDMVLRALNLGSVPPRIGQHFVATAPVWDYDVPIHPQVLDYYRIPWATAETRYHYLHGKKVNFNEYLHNYLRFEI